KNCTMCHGTATAWNTPTDRNHPTQQGAPVKPYTMACQGCHNTPSALGHILSQAAPNGAEGCATCHAVGKPEDVTLVHKAR
ncbi:MAG TPA: cytochrome c3 family protein, partial [Polyangiales bacterium]